MIILKNLFMILFHHFWSLSRKSVAFSRKTLAMLFYLCFASPKRYFDENFFFIEKLFSRTLLDKGQIYTGFLAKTFRQCCQNFILSVHRKFSGKKMFEKKFIFFQSFSDREQKNFRPVAKLFRQGCQNCNLRVQRNRFGRFFSFEKTKFFWMFRDNEWKTIGIWQEFFLLLGCQNCNLSFYRNNLCFFSNLTPSSFIDGPWAKEPGIMAKTIRHVCWYCILHVHRYSLRKKNSIFLNMSGTLGRRVRKSSACVIFFPAEVPEVLFRFTHKVSKENLSFKKNAFCNQFRTLSEKCLA